MSRKHLPIVPFVSYTSAESEDSWQMKEEREYETRTRHWALVWWKNAKGNRCTAEFMVITEYMPDFCGGMIVNSPRVDIFEEGCGWTKHFCAPGAAPCDKWEPLTTWKDFDESTAIDLAAFTGQEEWSTNEVEKYGYQCLIAQVCAEMLGNNKRGCVGADYVGGKMTKLFEAGVALGEITLPRLQLKQKITNKPSPPMVSVGRTWKAEFVAQFGEDWYNANSGNQVHWVTGNVIPTGGRSDTGSCWNCGTEFNIREEEYCPECEEYNEWEPDDFEGFAEGRYSLPDHVVKVVTNPVYVKRARRYFWRNG